MIMNSLTDIRGIGPALAKRLEAAGIVDCAALQAADPAVLTSIPGVTGTRVAAWKQAIAEMDATAAADTALEADITTDSVEAPADVADVVVVLPTAALPTLEEPDTSADRAPKAKKGKAKTKANDKPKAKKKKDAKKSDTAASDSKKDEKKKTAKKSKKKKKAAVADKAAKSKKKKAAKKKSDAKGKAKTTNAKAKKKKARAA